jgi:dolichyl-phosphate-mannose--protein O-mannosyl transferase
MLKKIIHLIKKNIGLVLIIVFYLTIAFYNFAGQGLVNWDEAYFVTVVNTFSQIVKTFILNPQIIFNGNFFQNLINNYGNIYTAARPSYIIPAIFINIIWSSEFSTRIVSLISGLLIIIFFYKILAFYDLGKKTKIGATFLIASSPLFLIYSKIGLSQIFSGAFLLICSYYFLKYNQSGEKKYLKNAALSLSVFGMSHYNTFPVAGIIFCFGVFIIFKKQPAFKNYLNYLFYILILPVAWEIVTRAGTIVASLKNISGGIVYSYSQEIIKQFFAAGGNKGFKLEQILYYPKILISMENFIFSALFLVGLVIILKNIKKINYLLILLPTFAHLLIFSATLIKFPRNIITILPNFYNIRYRAWRINIDLHKKI